MARHIMKENSRTESLMATEFKLYKMERNMKEILLMEFMKEKES